MSKYRVDNIPIIIKPFYLLLAYFSAILLRCYWWLIMKTCVIDVKGHEIIEKHSGRIEAVWHYKGFLYWLCKKSGHNYVQFSHPDWYMMYAIIILRWMGAKVILGSTGHNGKEAANRIVDEIKKGKACCVTPDGPFGPLKEIKKGILHMSQQSGLPIIPIEIQCTKYFRLLFSWDKKWIPCPFSSISITYKSPLYVNPNNFNNVHSQLTLSLGE